MLSDHPAFVWADPEYLASATKLLLLLPMMMMMKMREKDTAGKSGMGAGVFHDWSRRDELLFAQSADN